jgi:hypothetical protein
MRVLRQGAHHEHIDNYRKRTRKEVLQHLGIQSGGKHFFLLTRKPSHASRARCFSCGGLTRNACSVTVARQTTPEFQKVQ